MAIRCLRFDCQYNAGGYCTLDFIEIDEQGICVDFEEREEWKNSNDPVGNQLTNEPNLSHL